LFHTDTKTTYHRLDSIESFSYTRRNSVCVGARAARNTRHPLRDTDLPSQRLLRGGSTSLTGVSGWKPEILKRLNFFDLRSDYWTKCCNTNHCAPG